MFREIFIKLIILILFFGIVPFNISSIAEAAGESIIQLTDVPDGYIGIYSAEDLDNIRYNMDGQYILMSDIDLKKETVEGAAFFNNGEGWNPIGDKTEPFTGSFDGNGFEISGLTINIVGTDTIYVGLFGFVQNAQIQNVGMTSTSIKTLNNRNYGDDVEIYVGAIAGFAEKTTIENSYAEGDLVAEFKNTSSFWELWTYIYIGGLIGNAESSTIEKGSYTGKITANTNYTGSKSVVQLFAGGISGALISSEVNHSNNNGSITATSSGSTDNQSSAGGISGKIQQQSKIQDSFNTGEIKSRFGSGVHNAGGIAGEVSFLSKVINGKNSGNVSVPLSSYRPAAAGGIVGDLYYESSVETSSNTGDIGGDYAGGITGWANNRAAVDRSSNAGIVNSKSVAGGLVGRSDNIVGITKSYNAGNISTSEITGGIVGMGGEGTTIGNCFNTGNVLTFKSNGSSYAGGIAGTIEDGAITLSYNIGGIYTESDEEYAGIGGIAGNKGTWVVSYSLAGAIPNDKSQSNESTYTKSIEEMKQESTYEGFDFTSIWLFSDAEGFSFPQLRDLPYEEQEKTLNISVKTNIHKKVYNQDEKLDVSGGVILVRTSSGEEYEKELEPEMISGFDSAKVGEQKVKITYDGASTTFLVKVNTTFTVGFFDFDGSHLKTERIVEGSYAIAPDPPSRTGYTFTGWDAPFSQITSDLEVKATYKLNQYKVVFIEPEGTIINSQTVNFKSAAKAISNPIKPGYTFIGWYLDKAFTKKFDFKSPVLSDQTVFAGFVKNPLAPKNTTVALEGFDRLKISWSRVPDADGYEIYQSKDHNETYSRIATVSGDTIGLTNSGLTTGKTYFYKVRAYTNVNGTKVYGPYSDVKSGIPALTKVGSVKVGSAAYDKAKLSWGKVSGASGYEVHRATSSNGTYSNVKTLTSGSTVSYENGALTTGKAYYYKVRAYRTVDGKKVYSSFSSIVNTKPAIAAVTSAKATSAGYNKNKISWSKTSGASGYEVYRATSKSGEYGNIKTITSGSTSNYENSGLTAGKTYFYKVRAYRTVSGKKVFGAYSGIVSSAPTLAKPSKITVTKASSTSIKASWSKVSEASGYELYRAISKSGTYTKVKTQTRASAVSYTNSGLKKGKTYYYKVRAYRTVSGKKVYSSYTAVVSSKL